MLFSKFVYTIYVSFHRSRNYISVCSETIIDVAVILYLHVNLPDIIRPFANGLNGEFLESHLLAYDSLQSLDGSVYRAVSGGRLLKLLA